MWSLKMRMSEQSIWATSIHWDILTVWGLQMLLMSIKTKDCKKKIFDKLSNLSGDGQILHDTV